MQWSEIRDWRKGLRQQLLAQRRELAPAERHARAHQAVAWLRREIDLSRVSTLGTYWPINGEISVRELALQHLARGGRIGLPVVVTKAAPVEFWAWHAGCAMRKGLWDIPIPAEREAVVPEVLIVPLVGFDAQGYRLGYGGGYYDRTLAAAKVRPFCIGLGFEAGRLESIQPQTHDIPMDVIVTDAGVFRARSASP
jgi:5-formyltetrahydrofolate cyclo-ligase